MKLKRYFYTLFLCLFFCFWTTVSFAANVVSNIRTGQQTDGIRLVFDGTEKFQYDAFLLDNPNSLVIDIKNAVFSKTPKVAANQLISSFRMGNLNGKQGKRLVFELRGNADIKRKFALEPAAGQNNWRLVIDLVQQGSFAPAPVVVRTSNAAKTTAARPNPKRQKIVVLDPGHGGKDPGAIGRSYKTYEKNITLSMGKELKKQLEAKGFKVYMTRSTDKTLTLDDRLENVYLRLCKSLDKLTAIRDEFYIKNSLPFDMQMSYHSYYDDEKGSYEGAVPSIAYPSETEPPEINYGDDSANTEKISENDIKKIVSE